MANYNYKEKAYIGKNSWIGMLQEVDPTSSASAAYTDIHFTKPKTAVVSAMTHPHITFVANGSETRWYLKNQGGEWGFEVNGVTADDQSDIASNVLADALELNWIRQAETAKIVDEDGFVTKESKKNQKRRMHTKF
jgi:hypothetical protein